MRVHRLPCPRALHRPRIVFGAIDDHDDKDEQDHDGTRVDQNLNRRQEVGVEHRVQGRDPKEGTDHSHHRGDHVAPSNNEDGAEHGERCEEPEKQCRRSRVGEPLGLGDRGSCGRNHCWRTDHRPAGGSLCLRCRCCRANDREYDREHGERWRRYCCAADRGARCGVCGGLETITHPANHAACPSFPAD